MKPMRKQRGMSMIAMILVAALLGMAFIVALKLLPVYSEYFSIKSTLKQLASEQAGAPPSAIGEAFIKHATIENINSVKPENLDISEEGGTTTIAVKYAAEVPLIANISLKVNFETSASHTNPGG